MTTSWLLDTSELSELRRPKPTGRVIVFVATALHHGMTVATRDAGDFERTRIAVFDPWDAVPET